MCATAVALKRRAFNKWRRHPIRIHQLEYRKSEARARRVNKRAKKLSWRSFLSKLNMHTKCSEVWDFFRRFMGKGHPHCYPITANDTVLIDAMVKAELFATYFKAIIGYPIPIHEENRKLVFIRDCLLVDSLDDINTPFLISELNGQINYLKVKKSPGFDNIPIELIIHLPENMKLIILSLLNHSWSTRQGLSISKLADVLPILKPYKDETSPDSYRPISLISCLAKLFERLVYARLRWWLEMKSAFPNHQCGFRHNRSTLDVLLQLEHNAYKGFKEKSVTLVLFLDSSSAFDRASPTGLLYKLCILGLRV